MKEIAPGEIIILNGTSSSGKSTILKEIQKISPTPVLEIGLDKLIWMLPGRYLSQPYWDEVMGRANSAGTVGNQLVFTMHRMIAAASRAGFSVAADHVLIEPGWTHDCATVLAGLPAWLIGIYCPLAVLQDREKQRHDRTLGQAALQYAAVHAHGVYDLKLDTSVESPQRAAEKILNHVRCPNAPFALKNLFNSSTLQ